MVYPKKYPKYNYENLSNKETEISPFWRIIDPNSRLSDRLSFDKKIITENNTGLSFGKKSGPSEIVQGVFPLKYLSWKNTKIDNQFKFTS